nr:hypothetical protein [Tanacetum cinerariifolium]
MLPFVKVDGTCPPCGRLVKLPPIEGFLVRVYEGKPMGCPLTKLAGCWWGPTAKGVRLRVADSRTGNHPEDDFTLLETIRRLCSVFGRRSHLGFKGETSESKGREPFSVS